MPKSKKEVVNYSEHFNRVHDVHEEHTQILRKLVAPIAISFTPKDLVQLIVGATILAIPVGFSDEIGHFGKTLAIGNILMVLAISILFISIFVYYQYHSHHMSLKNHIGDYLKRVISTYAVSFIVVAFFLTMIQRTLWTTELIVSLKQVVLVSFPACMSAAVTDSIR